MKSRLIVIVLCAALLVACGPSQAEIQETVEASIALTEFAKPTKTSLPTETPIPTATATITPSPSPTPDVRLIDIDPRKLLLEKTDLPLSGRYVLPGSGWISPLTNSEIVSSWTVEEGKAYLAETGRVHGWEVVYRRGTNVVPMPEEVYDNVVIYSNIEGAKLVMSKYSDGYVTEDGYTEIEISQIGDITRAFKRTETDASGATREWLRIIFSYRNIYHTVALWGWEDEVNIDFATRVAKTLLDKLTALPLSDSVEFTP